MQHFFMLHLAGNSCNYYRKLLEIALTSGSCYFDTLTLNTQFLYILCVVWISVGRSLLKEKRLCAVIARRSD